MPSYEIGNKFAYLIAVKSDIFAASKLSVDNICAVGSTTSLERKFKISPESVSAYIRIVFVSPQTLDSSYTLGEINALLYSCIRPRNIYYFYILCNKYLKLSRKDRSYPTAYLPLCVSFETLKRISMKFGN